MYILFQVIDYIFKLFIFKLTFLVANVTVNYIFDRVVLRVEDQSKCYKKFAVPSDRNKRFKVCNK